MRIAVVSRERGAIGAHAAMLAAALRDAGHAAAVRTRDPLFAGLEQYDAVVVEYNPFLYGRRGIAPRLVFDLVRLRGPRVALVVHEPFVEALGPVGLWQRGQLFVLRAAADVVLVSIEAWTRRLARWRPRRPTAHLPSGSTLPDAITGAARSEDAFVVATLSSGHPSHLDAFVTAALRAIGSTQRTVLLALGDRPPPTAGTRVEVDAPGLLPDDELAARLSSAQLFLAPLVDGVSTRRTSVMAALQHGVPVVGTHGPLTDRELAESGALALAPADDEAAFAELAGQIAADAGLRAELGARGRALYEQRYSPARIAAILLDACKP